MAVGETGQEGVTELGSFPGRLADNTSLTPQVDLALSSTEASTSNATLSGTNGTFVERVDSGWETSSEHEWRRAWCRGAPIVLSVACFVL